MSPYKDKTVAFTGYRTEKIESSAIEQQKASNIGQKVASQSSTLKSIIVKIGEQTYTEICKLAEQGYDTFLSGMAEGFDMIAAQQVVRAREKYPTIRLVAVIPFTEQAYNFSPENKAIYEQLLREADSKIVLAESYYTNCYFARNDFLVANCSYLICYYDGQSGGTHYTVKKAIKASITIKNIAPLNDLFGYF